MPVWHRRERHSIRIARPPAEALAAARALTPREVPVLRVLMGLRTLPLALARRPRRRLDDPLLDGFARIGFAELGESETEIAYGGVGRFWAPSGDLRRVAAGDFADFGEPGYAKAAFNFVAEADGGGCVLSTETRILATDDAARRRFRLYWMFVRPGSGLIRRDWLRAIRARAERG